MAGNHRHIQFYIASCYRNRAFMFTPVSHPHLPRKPMAFSPAKSPIYPVDNIGIEAMSALAGRRFLKMNGLGNQIVVLDLRGTAINVSGG